MSSSSGSTSSQRTRASRASCTASALGGRATNSAEPLEYDGLEYAALPVRLNFIAYRHFRSRITPGAPSSTLQEFDADLVDIANVRGELAVVSQEIGNRESQRCSDPSE
jgi:hypothetical protein